MRITEAIGKYLAWKSTHTRKAPLSYAPYLVTFCKVLHNKNVSELTLDDVSTYHFILSQKHAPATVAYAMRIIKNFFGYLQSQTTIKVNPFMIKVPRFVPQITRVATDCEVEKLCSLLQESNYIDLLKLVAIRLLHDTGMRVSELCDLNTIQMDTVNRKTLIMTKKSYRPRVVMWTKETNRLLIKYLGVRICLNQKPGLLMGCRSKEHITPRSIQKWLVALCDEAKIRHLNPHSFRHHKAHEILNKSHGNVKAVQMILGHSNPMSSFKYLELNEEEAVRLTSRFV